MIGKALVEYFPPMKTCNKFTINMRPDIKYSRKMSEKSKSWFLTMKTEDPASNSGIISLFKGCVPYLPVIDDRHQKTPMFGDQGFFERGHNVSFSRSGEENLVERLDGLVSIPQEWHKKKRGSAHIQQALQPTKPDSTPRNTAEYQKQVSSPQSI